MKDILIDDLIERFCRLHLARQRQPRSVLCLIKNHFPPLRGRMLSSLTRLDILEWFQGIRSQAMANGALTQLRAMYTKAVEWELYEGENKAVQVKKHKRPSRSQFVQLEEVPALLQRLEREPLQMQVYFLFELITGCRPGEARLMQWTDLKIWDVDGVLHGRWTKPDTKIRLPHVIPLPTALCQRLLELPRTSDWVFTGVARHPLRKQPGPMSHTVVHKHWVKIRNDCGIPHITPHDLRRTCATYLDHHGASLNLISKGVLQHTNLQTTSRYVQQIPENVDKMLNAHAEWLLNPKGLT